MKKTTLLATLTVSALLPAQAALYSIGNVNGSGTSLNQTIYDANPSGITSSLMVSGAGSSLSAITVTLNLSGGYNGDLYGYLSYNGTLVTLLNRVGTGSGSPIQSAFGYSTSGFNNVTLDDAATGGSIHNVQNPGSLPTVSYTADGGSLAAFNGVDPNGTWTLFFADQAGGNTSTLNGWSLDITAVPEPVNVALGCFVAMLLALAGVRRMWRTKAVC
jgi:subtilisin-like proprotein convertase family protein